VAWEGAEDVKLASIYARAAGALLANVSERLTAKMVTAVISIIADVGSHDHAELANPW
jgi:hypothetical protein